MDHRPPGGLAALHAAVALFGFAALFGTWLTLSPVLIVLGRTLVAAATLMVVATLGSKRIGRPDLRLVAAGAVLALHWVTFFAAVQTAGVGIGLVGYASFPLFTLVLERVLLGRRWNARDAGAAVLVVTGLVLVVPRWTWHEQSAQGLAWGVLSALTFALLAIMNRHASARRRPADIALWQDAAAALCLLPFAGAAWDGASLTLRDGVLLLSLGVLCTALAHTLFIRSMRTVSATTASIVAALEPAYGIALAWALQAEQPGARVVAGAGVLIVAAILASRARVEPVLERRARRA